MIAAGASRVVCLVKEDVGTEVADFRSGYWDQEVFVDVDRRFYLALGGGKEHKSFGSLAAFLAFVANPFSKQRTKSHLAEAKQRRVAGNMTGEGFVQGGVYVVRQDGKAAYAFLEEDMGDHAPVEDVIEAVRAAVRGEEFSMAPHVLGDPAAEGAPRCTWKSWACRTSGKDSYQFGDISRGMAAGKREGCRRPPRGLR